MQRPSKHYSALIAQLLWLLAGCFVRTGEKQRPCNSQAALIARERQPDLLAALVRQLTCVRSHMPRALSPLCETLAVLNTHLRPMASVSSLVTAVYVTDEWRDSPVAKICAPLAALVTRVRQIAREFAHASRDAPTVRISGRSDRTSTAALPCEFARGFGESTLVRMSGRTGHTRMAARQCEFAGAPRDLMTERISGRTGHM